MTKATSGTPAKDNNSHARPLVITPKLLREWPLPEPDANDDKEARGRVLVIGGSPEIAGAVVLAATAALRAGAGKLQIGTGRSYAPHVAIAVPEARVIALPETKAGGIAAVGLRQLEEELSAAQSVLLGPGMVDDAAIARWIEGVVEGAAQATVVLDAGALTCSRELPEGIKGAHGRVALTPHAGEMAKLMGLEREIIEADPLSVVKRAVEMLNAVVALKGRETLIAAPASKNVYSNRAGNVGLATSGSGDTLSGVVAGLAARGSTSFQAAVWGVYLHARAGDELARRVGRLGFLARELLAEIPPLMAKLSPKSKVQSPKSKARST